MRILRTLLIVAFALLASTDLSAQGKGIRTSGRTRTVTRTVTDTVVVNRGVKSVCGSVIRYSAPENYISLSARAPLPFVRVELSDHTIHEWLGQTKIDIISGQKYRFRYITLDWTQSKVLVQTEKVDSCNTKK